MSKIAEPDSQAVKRQQIAPGIFMEKFQDRVASKNYYVIKIELKLFNVLDFTVDFTGSSNVQIEGQSSLVKTTVIQPFAKVEVARLLLEKKWNIKTKFKFTLQLPPVPAQKQFLEPIWLAVRKELADAEYLKKLDLGSMPEAQSLEYLQRSNLKFIDHEFPPISASIDESEQRIVQNFETLIHWRRLDEFMLSQEEREKGEELRYMFYEGISPMDVKQGKLGDCWLLSSIATLAEHPKLVERIILTKAPNKQGFYRVKLCRMSKWKLLVLDDFFPCFPMGEPIFSRNHGKELWVLLLEKAFAKMFGSYENLMGGDCKNGLIDLTGCPTYTFDFKEPKVKQQIDNGEAWNFIKEYDRCQYLVTVGTKDFESERTPLGLVKEHAYAILRVAEIDPKKFNVPVADKEKGVRLLNLRNPWGIFEWTGDWSDKSPLWTPELIEHIKPGMEEGDGNFWISWDNFLENFETLTVCKIAGWHELRIKGKFVKGIDQSNERINHFCSRWYYEIDVKEKSKVIFGIHQEDERYVGVKQTRPYLDIGLAVLSYTDGVYRLIDFKNSDFVREKYLEVVLEPGVYYLVPRSIGNCLSFDYGAKKEVSDFSPNNPMVVSVVRDIFEKYDIVANEFLSYKELKAFYEYIGLSLTEAEYNDLVLRFGKKEFKDAKLEGLSEKGFINLFFSLAEGKPAKYIAELFDKLGYNKSLFSFRTRIFMITIHSEKPVNMSIKDALTDNIDFAVIKLLIKKFGKSIDDSANPNKSPPAVEGFYYFNEWAYKQGARLLLRGAQPIGKGHHGDPGRQQVAEYGA